MEAKELMRFDWVHLADDNTPRQVDWIRSGEVGLFWNKTVTPPYLEPIPLTTEILEKNGFVYDSKDKLFEDIYPRISMLYAQYRLVENGGINYGEMSEIKYVHELQHALRLCGIEKEIVL